MPKRESVNIYELIELVRIPEFEDILYLKLESLKSGEFFNLLTGYRAKRDFIKKELMKEADEPVNLKYWFEITLYDKEDWRIDKLEPTPPPFYEFSEFLPRDIIDRIDDTQVDPNRLVSLVAVQSDFLGKVFDLSFTRYSRNHAFGAVTENLEARKTRIESLRFTESENIDSVFSVFYAYIKKNPDLKDYFFNKFLHLIQPQVKSL